MTNTKQILQSFLQSDYQNTDSVIEAILHYVFGNEKISPASKSMEVPALDKDKIKNITVFACHKDKNFPLNFVDVCIKDNVVLNHNRVTVQHCVKASVMEKGTSAIIFFHYENAKDKEWRISFVDKGFDKAEDTNPKRYTYICGKNSHCRTAAERFAVLKESLAKSGALNELIKDAFSVETITKEFYQKLFEWYEWAVEVSSFPVGHGSKVSMTKADNNKQIIRLITRLMFVWFIKQKDLIPSWIFDKDQLKNILADFEPTSKTKGNYYNAVIQNLFFATLNKAIPERSFTKENPKDQYGIKAYYRDQKPSLFNVKPEEVIKLFEPVPFLNGGLFECLDKMEDTANGGKTTQKYVDGFSREESRCAKIPNALFWNEETDEHEGLISLLSRYNFTVEENTPTDIQVALDPELLGKVFENLLGSFNPETQETARKDSGSFYTPREIVSFMTEQSLREYLKTSVKELTQEQLDTLFNEQEDKVDFSDKLKTDCAKAILNCKVLDPACGSGAFPMGMLNTMFALLKKLDYKSENSGKNKNTNEYNLKREIIEKCIYGSDIQPIAVQIAKLRFFISLVCEQEKTNDKDSNYGILPLPNLETKFVVANSLIKLDKSKEENPLFANPRIKELQDEIKEIRHKHFNAKDAKEKSEYRKQDKEKTAELIKLLENDDVCTNGQAKQLAGWNPYDQNEVSPFFDPDWMFGSELAKGFDICLGNPPYIQLQNNSGALAKLYENEGYKVFAKTGDIYCLFYERGAQLLKPHGHLCFITSNKWMRAGYGEKTREYLTTQTNPKLLVDFAGVKVFESATVDTNILLFEKAKNQHKTICAVTSKENKDSIKNLSVFVSQNFSVTDFNNGGESWVVLSEIEQSIKRKIEAVGTPLKDWDIQINYGIKTGFNDAFIISTEKRDEILANCKTEEERKKTAELIRPILRGRDIKRFSYEWANLWLVYIPWHFPLHLDNSIQGCSVKAEKEFQKQYPAVYNHLLGYKEQLSARNKAETGIRYEWYALQRWGANYWDDFFKPKVIYPETTQGAFFAFDEKGFMLDKTCFMLISKHAKYLQETLSSKLFEFAYKKIFSSIELGTSAYQYNKHALIKLPVKEQTSSKALSNEDVYNLYGISQEEIEYIESEIKL